ncbi:MAG: polyprenyl diphosphate synthase [Betaproteobacteria bacterium]|jgi:undecaprenyl diphosphate synthase|nr:di-trans,poly-cis-decaprenylcistransferase [Rhodocyclaceae bacterium]MCA3134325.1 di-trans,poly-cis-decaprenylcistransferase [Rhodocyclaceae bacterium]MCA3141212.1 di-trans,poly-cis-decaprenylcistransferase [Rhodocyclaceae bacterium]MCA3145111.1 di-trans,poly-cis-decaprenylcistransferase [Rhodocyclaceae bacterium]MCE2896488.1 polyprenyl diphosphate synthase [Betaproteobacteria bacterium]
MSSTLAVPEVFDVPRHVAIIMDGNGRWAKRRFLPRAAGHRRGVQAVRTTVEACVERGVEFLTLFAFSSENWRRPADEVSFLMSLFVRTLERQVARLHEGGVRLKVIGDRAAFEPRLVALINDAEALTAENRRLTLSVAANYGGRWDLLQAMNRMLEANPHRAGNFGESDLAPWLATAYAPEPDLFIRTGGEKRISNFLLWHLAYTELHFTDTLWPDFGSSSLDAAIESYRLRERRFGRTSEQLVPDAIATVPSLTRVATG